MKFFLVFLYLDTETSWSFWWWTRRRWCPCCWWRCPRRPRAEWSRARRPRRWTTPWWGGSSWSDPILEAKCYVRRSLKGLCRRNWRSWRHEIRGYETWKKENRQDQRRSAPTVPGAHRRWEELGKCWNIKASKIQIEKREVNPESGNNLVNPILSQAQGLDHKMCTMDVSDFCSRPSSKWWDFQTYPRIQFNINYRAQIIPRSTFLEENFQRNYHIQCSLLYISLNCCMYYHVLYLPGCCWICDYQVAAVFISRPTSTGNFVTCNL